MTLSELASEAGKSVPAVMVIQKKYGLHPYDDYSDGYAVLLKKVVYLAVFSVPAKDVKLLHKRERALLQLLKVDSAHSSPQWFEVLCCMKTGPKRLLLSGYDVGNALTGGSVQTGLDFKQRPDELFSDDEMGVDVLRGVRRYTETLERVRERLVAERENVRQALKWGREAV